MLLFFLYHHHNAPRLATQTTVSERTRRSATVSFSLLLVNILYFFQNRISERLVGWLVGSLDCIFV